MNRFFKKAMALVLAGAFVFGAAVNTYAADAPETTVEGTIEQEEVTVEKGDKPYIALGENLKPEERATVLSLLGVTEDQLADFDVVTVTNEQEHKYLDTYISSDKIGTRALSSVVVMKGEKGSGIKVTTKNINYCTSGMYQNALATAGVSDAEVIVAGPFELSGTAALIGAIEAYSVMTGDKIDEQIIDGAIDEIVTTGEIEQATGDTDEVEGMIAYLKEQLAESENLSDEELQKEIESAADQFNVSLSQDEIDKLIALLKKLQSMDLDWGKITEHAKNMYQKLQGMGIDIKNLDINNLDTEKIEKAATGIFGKLIAFIKNLLGR